MRLLFRRKAGRGRRLLWVLSGLVAVLGVVAGFWFGPRLLSIKAGAIFLRPSEGVLDPESQKKVLQTIGALRARIVWSSSRTGNHEIYMLSLPDFGLFQLTSNDRVDFFPRFSPDGRQVVFARSQRSWVSEREIGPWDIYLLSLQDGRERLLAKNANYPSWVDQKRISFVRHGREVVVLDIDKGEEQVIAPAPWMPREWKHFVFAEFSPGNARQLVLITPPYGMFHVDGERKTWQQYGSKGVCEITWAPDASSVLWMQSRGQGGSRIMSSPMRPGQEAVLFDAPGAFSHEYFPRLSRDGRWLIFAASTGGHEHDLADYELFLWQVGQPWDQAIRLTANPANDRWPDIILDN